jgi:hypothetical protein
MRTARALFVWLLFSFAIGVCGPAHAQSIRQAVAAVAAADAGTAVATAAAGTEAGTAGTAGPPAGANGPALQTETEPAPRSTLRSRTREFEPSRFNLSPRGGQGLMQALSPYTLAPWEVGAAVSVLNFDRNPGDIDFFEYGYQGAIGLPGRVELFFRGAPVLRTNSVNQDPVGYPVPPLDLFVDIHPTPALRQQPYFLFAQEVPYKSYYLAGVKIEPPGHGAFGSSSGGYGFGAKVNLLSEARGHAIGFGVRGYVEIPSEEPSYNTTDWRNVAGVSGRSNIGGDLLVGRRLGRSQLLGNIGYKHVGDPTRGLRVQYVDSSRWDTLDVVSGAPVNILVGDPVETKLDLRDQVSGTIGTAVPAMNIKGLQFWLLGEVGYTRYVSGATRVERLVHPVEMRLGIQANVPRFPNLSLGAAWQLLFNDAGHGTPRWSPFATPDGRGDINFSPHVDPGLASAYEQFFGQRGGEFTPNASRMFSTDNPRFDSSRNVPVTESTIVGMGGGNILGFITWRVR